MKLIQSLLFQFSFLLSANTFFSVANAEPQCPHNKELRVALYELGFFYSESSNKGLDLDIINELQKRSGCRFNVSVMPRARIWKEIKDGSLDLATSGIKTADRENFAQFLPYVQQKNYAIVSSKLLKDNSDIKKLFNDKNSKLRWAKVRGFRHDTSSDAFLNKMQQTNRLDEAMDSKQLFTLLQADRVSGIFALPMVYNFELAGEKSSGKFTIIDWFPNESAVEHGLVFSKKNYTREQMKFWMDVINDMKKDGTLKKLISKYLTKDELNAALVP